MEMRVERIMRMHRNRGTEAGRFCSKCLQGYQLEHVVFFLTKLMHGKLYRILCCKYGGKALASYACVLTTYFHLFLFYFFNRYCCC